jgi:hypothetical protein
MSSRPNSSARGDRLARQTRAWIEVKELFTVLLDHLVRKSSREPRRRSSYRINFVSRQWHLGDDVGTDIEQICYNSLLVRQPFQGFGAKPKRATNVACSVVVGGGLGSACANGANFLRKIRQVWSQIPLP